MINSPAAAMPIAPTADIINNATNSPGLSMDDTNCAEPRIVTAARTTNNAKKNAE